MPRTQRTFAVRKILPLPIKMPTVPVTTRYLSPTHCAAVLAVIAPQPATRLSPSKRYFVDRKVPEPGSWTPSCSSISSRCDPPDPCGAAHRGRRVWVVFTAASRLLICATSSAHSPALLPRQHDANSFLRTTSGRVVLAVVRTVRRRIFGRLSIRGHGALHPGFRGKPSDALVRGVIFGPRSNPPQKSPRRFP